MHTTALWLKGILLFQVYYTYCCCTIRLPTCTHCHSRPLLYRRQKIGSIQTTLLYFTTNCYHYILSHTCNFLQIWELCTVLQPLFVITQCYNNSTFPNIYLFPIFRYILGSFALLFEGLSWTLLPGQATNPSLNYQHQSCGNFSFPVLVTIYAQTAF